MRRSRIWSEKRRTSCAGWIPCEARVRLFESVSEESPESVPEDREHNAGSERLGNGVNVTAAQKDEAATPAAGNVHETRMVTGFAG